MSYASTYTAIKQTWYRVIQWYCWPEHNVVYTNQRSLSITVFFSLFPSIKVRTFFPPKNQGKICLMERSLAGANKKAATLKRKKVLPGWRWRNPIFSRFPQSAPATFDTCYHGRCRLWTRGRGRDTADISPVMQRSGQEVTGSRGAAE